MRLDLREKLVLFIKKLKKSGNKKLRDVLIPFHSCEIFCINNSLLC